MLRCSSNLLTQLTLNGVKCSNSALALEFVRWRRKPRWVPTAKSKLNRDMTRKRQPADERVELLRLNNNYKLQLRSVRQYLREEAHRVEETSTADHIVLTPEQEEENFQRCLQENEAWNAVIAAEREIRLEKERTEHSAYIAERLEIARVREEKRSERIEAIVRREKELSKTFVTRDGLDSAIEFALANPVDYNFSIDVKGNMYRGRTTVPESGGSGGTPNRKKETEQQQLQLEASN